VIQRYIANPMLFNGRKFHVRLYLGLFGERAVLFDDGIVRVAPGDYSSDFNDQRRHITNTLRFSGNEETRRATQVMTLNDLKLSPEIQANLRALARDLAAIIHKAGVALARLTCSPADIPPKLLGLDILIGVDGRPWLLEVERYPALHGGSPKADAVNARLFQDFAKVLAVAESS
jgi:Tubulin-tyrosine ligase family